MVISVPSLFLFSETLNFRFTIRKSYDVNSCLEARVWDPIFRSYNVKRRRRQKILKLLTPASSAGDAIHRSKASFQGVVTHQTPVQSDCGNVPHTAQG